jgi:aminoglycoside phosphotransferase (APT) family kinase protein
VVTLPVAATVHAMTSEPTAPPGPSTGSTRSAAPPGETTAVSDGQVPPVGVDVPAVSAWLEGNVAGAVAPFSFELIAGGHSNLTYRVVGADGHPLVLRRPPLGHLLASAHDMGREHRIIAALAGTPVPVAPARGFCADVDVSGAPFYIMDFVDGHVIRDRAAAEATLAPTARRTAGEDLVDTLAAIHAVDIEAVGLSDLGRHEGYIARQLKRWYGQWQQSQTRPLSTVDEVHDLLSSRIPEQGPACIVHGDYRLDNTMVDDSGHIIAVLDWEICTLGDPMADVGLLMVYWTGPGDEASAWTGSAPTAPGFPDRAELLARYAAVSGRDLGTIDFYVAFAFWKLACILEGVYARYLAGALGGGRDPSEHDTFRQQVEQAADQAALHAARL